MTEKKQRAAKRVFTEEEDNFLRSFVPGHSYAQILEEFSKRFVVLTRGQLAGRMLTLKLKCGVCPRHPQSSETRALLSKIVKKRYKENPVERIPIGSEHHPGAYTMIKIAQPDVWESKGRYIWKLNHEGEQLTKAENIIFLNGDKTDFRPENLYKINKRYAPAISKRHLITPYPELTLANIKNLELEYAILDAQKKNSDKKRR